MITFEPTTAAVGRGGGGVVGIAPSRLGVKMSPSTTVIPRNTAALTAEQIRAATDIFCTTADGSVSPEEIGEMLASMNLIPPVSFKLREALESIEASTSQATLDDFLAVVNGVWVALDELAQHDALVRNAFEALHSTSTTAVSDGSGVVDALGSSDLETSQQHHRGGFGGPSSATFSTSSTLTANNSDPIAVILASHASRGLRNFQQLLSPGGTEPELLKSFIRLGARESEDGYGFSVSMQRFRQRCEALGISAEDAVTIAHVFDKDQNGEIDYDEFLGILTTDLDRLGLKPHVVEKMRKVLLQPAATGSSLHTKKSFAFGDKSMRSVTSPPAPQHDSAASGVPSDSVGATTDPFDTSAFGAFHRNSMPRRQTTAPGAFGGFGRPSYSSHSEGGAVDDENSTFDSSDDAAAGFAAFSAGDLGRSLFFNLATRHASVVDTAGNEIPFPLLHAANPHAFYTKIQDDLMKCKQNLENLKAYEREADRLRRRASVASSVAGGGGISPSTPGLSPPPDGTPIGTPMRPDMGAHEGAPDASRRSFSTPRGGQSPSKQPSHADVGTANPTAPSGTAPKLPPASPNYGKGRNPLIPAYRYGVPPPPIVRLPAVSPRLLEAHDRFSSILVRNESTSPRSRVTQACGLAPCPPASFAASTCRVMAERSVLSSADSSDSKSQSSRRQQPPALTLKPIAEDDLLKASLRKLVSMHGESTMLSSCDDAAVGIEADGVESTAVRVCTSVYTSLPSPRHYPSSPFSGRSHVRSQAHNATATNISTTGNPLPSPTGSSGKVCRPTESPTEATEGPKQPHSPRPPSKSGVPAPTASRGSQRATTSSTLSRSAPPMLLEGLETLDTETVSQGGLAAIPSVTIGGMIHRDKQLKQKLFERTLATGSLCGPVVSRRLAKHPGVYTAVYHQNVPRQ